MTRLWEENKPLVIVAGVCILLLIVVRPNLFSLGPPVAHWMGLTWKADYDGLTAKDETLATKLREFDPAPGSEEISAIEGRIEVSNRRLKENFEQYVHSLAFVPYRPFLPPYKEPEGDWGHYFRDELTRTREQLQRYCSPRDVTVAEDLGFAAFDSGLVPSGRDVENLLRQLAVADTFVRLCADSQIKETRIVTHGARYTTGTIGRNNFIWEYPMQVRLTAGFFQLMKLLESLNGHQALVKDVQVNELRAVVEKVTLTAGSADGVRPDDQFTLFKMSPDRPCELQYAGRATVTNLSDDGAECVARVDEDLLPYEPTDSKEKEPRRIGRGDFASTGFFRVAKINVRALPGSVQSVDTEGIPTKIIPQMMEVILDLSTIGFDPATEPITVQNFQKLTGGRIKPLKPQKADTGTHPPVRPGRPW